jgi:hypothetical protein
LGLSFGSAQSILTEDLGMKCVSTKFVPKLLTVESHLVQNFLNKHHIPQVLQPPYSLDMVLCDFFLFPDMKMLLKGNGFQDMEETKHEDTAIGYSKESLPKVLRPMEGLLKQVCAV